MHNQLPLFLPYDQVQALPIVQKYEKIFAELDLSHVAEFNTGIGANGTSQHALMRRMRFVRATLRAQHKGLLKPNPKRP